MPSSPSWRRCVPRARRPRVPPRKCLRSAARPSTHQQSDRMSHPIASGSEAQAAVGLLAWSFEPAVTIPIAVAAIVYGCGWATIRHRLPERFGTGRPAAFAVGLGAIVLALCSPIDAAGAHLLRAHMLQHMLLMLVAPPLLWAG